MMVIELAVLFILFIVSLFILYELSKNDFVLLRKNVSLTQMFDYSFFTFLGGLVFSRLLYILDSQKFYYLHPINFLHIAHLPGLSAIGFFLGCAVTLFVIFYRKKVIRRVFDIFFSSVFPIFIFIILFMRTPRSLFFVPIILVLICIVLFSFMIHSLRNYSLKDGSVALIFFISVAVFTIGYSFIVKRVELIAHLSFLQIISTIVAAVSVVLLLINQQVIKIKKQS